MSLSSWSYSLLLWRVLCVPRFDDMVRCGDVIPLGCLHGHADGRLWSGEKPVSCQTGITGTPTTTTTVTTKAEPPENTTTLLVSFPFGSTVLLTYPPTDRSIDWLDKKDHGLHIINRGECGLTTTKGMVELPRKCSCESCVAHARLLCSLRGKRATQRQTMTHQLIAVTVGIHPSICLFA